MISYLRRYQESRIPAREHPRIWAELTSLGAEVRKEPLYADARAVARETMMRAKGNIEVLVRRLRDMGYRFAFPEAVWPAPDPTMVERLDLLEERFGSLPLSIRVWYEVVGPVNLTGSHPGLNHYHPLEIAGSEPWLIYPDPLVIDPFPEELESFYMNLEYDDTGEEAVGPPYSLELAADAVTKAAHSGGGPTAILIPNTAIDAPLISDDWEGVLFVNYLRTCFEWGGFPGWRNQPRQPRELLEHLRSGLAPL